MSMDDDKHAKFKAETEANEVIAKKVATRRVMFYLFLGTIIFDAYASKGDSLLHLTMWSLILHTLYFELYLSTSLSYKSIRILHGPSFCGAHALFMMYIWTLIANPSMEFDLAPEGRATWLIYARGTWIHLSPLLFHWKDINENQSLLKQAYAQNEYSKSKLFQFWACLGGYFAMGLTWEQVNGDVSGTYNVSMVTPETFVNVSKAISVVSCVLPFIFILKPKLID